MDPDNRQLVRIPTVGARSVPDAAGVPGQGTPKTTLRILGVSSLLRRYGLAVEDACPAPLEMGLRDYGLVRPYLERQPTPRSDSAPSRSPHRALTSAATNQGHPKARVHQSELGRARRQLDMGGIANRPSCSISRAGAMG